MEDKGSKANNEKPPAKEETVTVLPTRTTTTTSGSPPPSMVNPTPRRTGKRQNEKIATKNANRAAARTRTDETAPTTTFVPLNGAAAAVLPTSTATTTTLESPLPSIVSPTSRRTGKRQNEKTAARRSAKRGAARTRTDETAPASFLLNDDGPSHTATATRHRKTAPSREAISAKANIGAGAAVPQPPAAAAAAASNLGRAGYAVAAGSRDDYDDDDDDDDDHDDSSDDEVTTTTIGLHYPGAIRMGGSDGRDVRLSRRQVPENEEEDECVSCIVSNITYSQRPQQQQQRQLQDQETTGQETIEEVVPAERKVCGLVSYWYLKVLLLGIMLLIIVVPSVYYFGVRSNDVTTPATVPSVAPTATATTVAMSVIFDLLIDYIPDLADMSSRDDSAEYRAMKWLALDNGDIMTKYDNETFFIENIESLVQRFVMAVIYFDSIADTTNLSNWLSSVPTCNWHGLWCNDTVNRGTSITDFILSDSGFGTIPTALGLLSTLTMLDLGMDDSKIMVCVYIENRVAPHTAFFLFAPAGCVVGKWNRHYFFQTVHRF
jgi:hypothetical protein